MIYRYRIRLRGLEDDILSASVPQLPRCIVHFRASQMGPSPLLGGHEQRFSLGSFAVMFHNPTATMYYVFARVF